MKLKPRSVASDPSSPSLLYTMGVPDGEPFVAMCGDIKSPLVIVTAHPNEEEKSVGKPLCSSEGRLWAEIFEKHVELRVHEALVFSSSPYGAKASVDSTRNSKSLCRKISDISPRNFVFCGALEFGLTFNGYRKKSSSGLFGALMFLPDLPGSTVTVLPSGDGLFPKSNKWQDEKDATYRCEMLSKFVSRFSKLLKSAVNNRYA